MVYYEWEGCSDGCEEALSLSPYVSQDAVGSSFQFAYMVDEASPEGTVEHMVREVFDLASNEMVDGSLTSLDLVTIDTTLPSVLSVEIASDNELPELAIVGDTITVRIELVEYSSTPHIELVQVDGAGCSDGCAVSMDVVHAVASSDGSGVIDGETCAQLGLVACASGAGVTVCVPDGSECGGHDESRDAGWSDHESTCSALGLALCSVIDGVPLCVPDDSGCSDAGAAPARRERPLVFAQAYEATYTVTESSLEGAMHVRISSFEDQSGNVGAEDSWADAVVEIDTTSPEVMWVGAESDGADAHFAKAGDMISASIKMSEAVRSEMGVWLVVAEGMEASPSVDVVQCAMLGLTPCAGPEGEITCAASCSDDEVRVDGCADGWCWRAMEYAGESVEGSIVMYDFVTVSNRTCTSRARRM
jgi:hypothetical protein